jgi:hypothetical protein
MSESANGPANTEFAIAIYTNPCDDKSPSTEPSSTGCTLQQNDAYVDQMLRLINQAALRTFYSVFLQSQYPQPRFQ